MVNSTTSPKVAPFSASATGKLLSDTDPGELGDKKRRESLVIPRPEFDFTMCTGRLDSRTMLARMCHPSRVVSSKRRSIGASAFAAGFSSIAECDFSHELFALIHQALTRKRPILHESSGLALVYQCQVASRTCLGTKLSLNDRRVKTSSMIAYDVINR